MHAKFMGGLTVLLRGPDCIRPGIRCASSNRVSTVEKSDQTSESSDAALKARLDKLSGAIKSETAGLPAERKSATSSHSVSSSGTAMGTGLRVGSELIAGVLVGGFIGWWMDHWLGTSPLCLLVMLALGMVSGFWNVYRIAARPTGAGTHKNYKGSHEADPGTK
jgi:ATP synthase protein I